MLRHASLLSLVLAAVPTLVAAQGHPTHHHPRGAKIIMIGTLVNPTCAFVQQAADSAQSRCVQQQRSALPPVLMGDGELYVLDFSQAPAYSLAPLVTSISLSIRRACRVAKSSQCASLVRVTHVPRSCRPPSPSSAV